MLRVMIIGAGAIAPAHVEGILQFPDRAEIVVVINRDITRAENLIANYKLLATAGTDYRLHLDNVDVAIICTPPNTHTEIAVTCLSQKKHVLLEKPMALSLEECDAICSATDKAGVIVSVVAQSRFVSSVYNTINLIKSGIYGSILMTDVNSHWYRGASYYDLQWRGRWDIEGGGCIQNHTVHHIDLLLWAKGLPASVMAYMTNLSHSNSEEEDLAIALLTYVDGTVARITSSLIHHGEKQSIDFQLKEIGISIPFDVVASKGKANGFPVENQEEKDAFLQAYHKMPELPYTHHTGQINNFLYAIEHNRSPLITGESGRMTIELITAIYKAAITEQRITLPLKKDDPYYTFSGRVKDAPHFHNKTKDVTAFDDLTITSFKGKYER